MYQAKEEARKQLQEAKNEADRIIQEMRKAARENQMKISQRELEEGRAALREKLGEVEGELSKGKTSKKSYQKTLTEVILGQEVFVTTFDQVATVLSQPDEKGDLFVQAGIMKMKVNLNQLVATNNTIQETKKSGVRTAGVKRGKSQNISAEIDLRGQLAEEALGNVDKYLDDAYLAKLPQVTLIHGKGTGALRGAIQQHLRRHPLVKTYRLGKFGEGESGVTVVELKQ